MVQKLYIRLKKSIWLFPTITSIGSLLLAILIRWVDLKQFDHLIPKILLTDVDLAKDILGIISGAFITITTFTFSTTMIVLTMYTSQLSPRVVENFLNNKNTMKSFGIFMGGFVYAIMSLLFLQSQSENALVVSASIGVVYISVGFVYFMIFINDVAGFIQMSNIIDRLYDASKEKIHAYLDLYENHRLFKEVPTEDYNLIYRIYADNNGYIQLVNYDKLKRIAEEMNLVLVFEKVVGEYVYTNDPLFSLHSNQLDMYKKENDQAILDAVTLGYQKTEEQDFSYTIQKIVEVGLRAISPGINDPNTAIHCIRIIGSLLGILKHIESGYLFMGAENQRNGLYIEAYDYQKIMQDAFEQFDYYGKNAPKVMGAIDRAKQYLEG